MSHITLTDNNFKLEVIDNPLPVIVDFWAPWCPPCKLLDPILSELEKEYDGKILVGKINADENTQSVSDFSVMSMPTIILFKDGQPVKSLIGAYGKDEYKRAIDELLSSSTT